MNDRTRIDDAIDRAVRDIVRRDPPAGLRARVRSRLAAPTRRVLTWPRLAVATAAAAMLVTAIVTMRPAVLPPSPPGARQSAVDRQVAEQAQPPVAAAAPFTASTPVPARRVEAAREPLRTATFGTRDGRISAASLDTGTVPPPAPGGAAAEGTFTASPAPIVVDALLPPAPIEIAPIVVAPIHLPRIQPSPAAPPR